MKLDHSQFRIRVPVDLGDCIRKAAEQGTRSVNSQILRAIMACPEINSVKTPEKAKAKRAVDKN